ncbi:MAG: exosortase-associated EpsI family protein [Pirellulaceae bacterium]
MKYASIAISLLLLTGMAVARVYRPQPADAAPYHEHVRQVAGSLPIRIGDWVGTDLDVPPAAIKMLQPNVLVYRQYHQLETGQIASLLLVQCKDARDLAGHFPPVCYPAHGWEPVFSRPHTWRLDDRTIDGMEYGFDFRGLQATQHMVVANFMVLPDGQFLRDMKGVRRAAADYTRHFLGAAQFQIVMDASIPESQRDKTVQQLLEGCRETIDAIRSSAPSSRDSATLE